MASTLPPPFGRFPIGTEEIFAAWGVLLPNVLGIVVSLGFIFEFYRFVARRDVFRLRLRGYAGGSAGRVTTTVGNALRVGLYLLERVVVYPILVVIWYLAFAAFLAFVATGLAIESILLVAMAVVAAFRVTAYYSEDLSRDLAKMLPLALLGVVILQGASSVSVRERLALILEIPAYWRRVLSYLLLLIPLEFALRLLRIVTTRRLSTTGPGEAGSGGDPGV